MAIKEADISIWAVVGLQVIFSLGILGGYVIMSGLGQECDCQAAEAGQR